MYVSVDGNRVSLGLKTPSGYGNNNETLLRSFFWDTLYKAACVQSDVLFFTTYQSTYGNDTL